MLDLHAPTRPITAVGGVDDLGVSLHQTGAAPPRLFRQQVIVHYIGVDRDFFRADRQPIRHPVVLFAARLIEMKGATYLIRAMREVQARVRGADWSSPATASCGRGWRQRRGRSEPAPPFSGSSRRTTSAS